MGGSSGQRWVRDVRLARTLVYCWWSCLRTLANEEASTIHVASVFLVLGLLYKGWLQAITAEWQALNDHGTFRVVPISEAEGKKLLSAKPTQRHIDAAVNCEVQRLTSTSTCQAELISLTDTFKEALHIRLFLEELGALDARRVGVPWRTHAYPRG